MCAVTRVTALSYSVFTRLTLTLSSNVKEAFIFSLDVVNDELMKGLLLLNVHITVW